jgi:hypothetical protein
MVGGRRVRVAGSRRPPIGWPRRPENNNISISHPILNDIFKHICILNRAWAPSIISSTSEPGYHASSRHDCC